MRIRLDRVSKKFQKHWVFKNIETELATPDYVAILGNNGSGKSTLLRIIAGMQAPSFGKVYYTNDEGVALKPAEIFKSVSFCAPSQELIEELTMEEFLRFHFSFKKLLPEMTIETIIELTGLSHSAQLPLSDYSSGMKQRVKLAQAIFADTPILLLDEPCTNLDEHGFAQYREWLLRYAAGRLVIIASNDRDEYPFCEQFIDIGEYK
jgi:ABC-type multidrug transport system ATPase subunit